MTEAVELIGKLGSQIGPVGVFLLVALVVYQQGQRTKRYHAENLGTLSTIESSASSANRASEETLRIVREMHGRIIALEVWKGTHDEHDNERFRRLEQIVEALRSARTSHS